MTVHIYSTDHYYFNNIPMLLYIFRMQKGVFEYLPLKLEICKTIDVEINRFNHPSTNVRTYYVHKRTCALHLAWTHGRCRVGATLTFFNTLLTHVAMAYTERGRQLTYTIHIHIEREDNCSVEVILCMRVYIYISLGVRNAYFCRWKYIIVCENIFVCVCVCT